MPIGFPPDKSQKDSQVQKYGRIGDFYRQYMELLNEYSPQIKFIQEQLENVRKEREELLKSKVPSIRKALNGLPIKEEYKVEWIEQYIKATEKSLEISENLLNSFYVATAEEYRKKLEDIWTNETGG